MWGGGSCNLKTLYVPFHRWKFYRLSRKPLSPSILQLKINDTTFHDSRGKNWPMALDHGFRKLDKVNSWFLEFKKPNYVTVSVLCTYGSTSLVDCDTVCFIMYLGKRVTTDCDVIFGKKNVNLSRFFRKHILSFFKREAYCKLLHETLRQRLFSQFIKS